MQNDSEVDEEEKAPIVKVSSMNVPQQPLPFDISTVGSKAIKTLLRKSTLNTAADLAAHRRSMITGKLRKLSENKSSVSMP